MSANKTLKKLGLNEFKPLPLITSGLAQTIAAAYWPTTVDRLSKKYHDILLDDGDALRVVENRPAQWSPGDRIVILVHGLAGSHESNYMVRMAQRLYKQNILVIRVNLRGCGVGHGLARFPYHSGRSEDLRFVLRWLQQKFSSSPVTQVGYSLGANITLKLAGEDGTRQTGNLDSVVAISPPADLAKTALHLRNSSNVLFDQFFVWKLRYDTYKLHKQFPDIPRPKIPLKISLTQFDDYYTAPRSGFSSAQDYYSKSSSAPLVQNIDVPCLILCSHDDPIIEAKSVANLKLSSSTELVMTKAGGHVGFLGRAGSSFENQWMDNLIARWVDELK